MGKSVLNDKWILAVSHQPLVLMDLEKEMSSVAPNSHVDKATHFKDAVERMASFTYDLVILDGLGSRSSSLLSRAVNRFPAPPVVILGCTSINSETVREFVRMGGRICPPKENFREMIPCLENAFRHERSSGCRRLLEYLTELFGRKIITAWQERRAICGRLSMAPLTNQVKNQ